MNSEKESIENQTEQTSAKVRKPRIRLPFENRKEDAGEWAYDHRVGLCVTIILYLLLAIAAVASKITLGERSTAQSIYVELPELQSLEDENERLRREIEQRKSSMDWNSVRNVTSNENVLNENLRDDRGTRTDELNRLSSEVAERVRANQQAYEEGLAEAEAAGRRPAEQGTHRDEKRSDARVKGMVTVSLSIDNPVRYSRHLEVPAYRCEGGGEVIVQITVNRAGDVIAASIVSGGDECMREASLRAARMSSVNIDESAPPKQNGTLTYIFIPQ